MTGSAQATGYKLTMPGGWTRITTGEGSQQSQAAFVAEQTRQLSGAEKVLAQRQLATHVARATAEAEAAGALDLYSYARTIRGIPVAMNFTIGVVYLGPDIDQYGDEGLLELAGIGAADVSFVESPTAGRMTRSIEHREQTQAQLRDEATRVFGKDVEPTDTEIEREITATLAQWEAEGVTRRQVRVSYLIEIPDAAGSFVLAAFDADDGALSEALVFHFDTIISTFSWV